MSAVILESMKALRRQSESAPQSLYADFDFFVNLLDDPNSIVRWNAMLILGNLASIVTARKIATILPHYLAPIAGPRLIDASNTIRGAVAIALAQPKFAAVIAASILSVEHAVYATPECRNVAIGHAIRALQQLMPLLADQQPVRDFVTRHLDNPRPATRKKAEKFLRIQ